ncbi:MAG: sulfide/dihydroorotate dehydrogenase-like FAD/NAD-binding protein, partial [Archaeoglobaceae archaeon]
SDEFYAATDDGSYGYQGLDFIKEILEQEEIDRVYGMSVTTETLRELSNITWDYGVKTICALTPVMVDGSGMCGACRVVVGGEKKFACVDGPDFDAHQVDGDVLEKRKRMYSSEEKLLLLSQKMTNVP